MVCEGFPCVAQRVCPMPNVPLSAFPSSVFSSRLRSLPTALTTSAAFRRRALRDRLSRSRDIRVVLIRQAVWGPPDGFLQILLFRTLFDFLSKYVKCHSILIFEESREYISYLQEYQQFSHKHDHRRMDCTLYSFYHIHLYSQVRV